MRVTSQGCCYSNLVGGATGMIDPLLPLSGEQFHILINLYPDHSRSEVIKAEGNLSGKQHGCVFLPSLSSKRTVLDTDGKVKYSFSKRKQISDV